MFEKHEYILLKELIELILKGIHTMSTLEDQVIVISNKLDAVLTALANPAPVVVPPPVVDFAPVLNAIAAEDAEHKTLSDKLDAVLAQFATTPAAPAPAAPVDTTAPAV